MIGISLGKNDQFPQKSTKTKDLNNLNLKKFRGIALKNIFIKFGAERKMIRHRNNDTCKVTYQKVDKSHKKQKKIK